MVKAWNDYNWGIRMSNFLIMIKSWSEFSIMLRLVVSVIAGGIIGFDRAIKRRGAGMKTHVLVCLGATLVMITGQFIQLNYDGTMDVARLGAQVISGVGFLGVGTIIVTGKNQVRGLTTAAGLWTCACIGLAIGIGFVDGAFFTLILVIFSFNVLSKIDGWIEQNAKTHELYLEFPTNQCVSEFINEMHQREIKIMNFELGKSKIKGEGPNAVICIEIKNKKQRTTIMDDIHKMTCVKYAEEL